MNKQVIGKILVVTAMACLTFIFAALSVHYDVFHFRFDDNPIEWTELLLLLGACVVVGIVGLGIACLAAPETAIIFIMPFEIWDYISEKYGKRMHLINVFLLALCLAFIAYTVNLVAILEHLSGEHYRQEPTLGGFLTVFYAWIIVFGTFTVFGWLSGLIDAFGASFKKLAEMDKQCRIAQEKKNKKKKRAKKVHFEKL
ncbi:MAG: hypothetical protein VZR95_02440 [Alphaproteobacteria bacterium]